MKKIYKFIIIFDLKYHFHKQNIYIKESFKEKRLIRLNNGFAIKNI